MSDNRTMSHEQQREIIAENYRAVRCAMDEASDRAGRDPDSVRLVAVTKYAEWQWVECLADYHTVFGENRPQQLAERQSQRPDVQWHLIGQLQRNKVRSVLQHASVVHSVDSLRLLQRIALLAGELELRPNVLLQVNVTGESSKSGFCREDITTNWPQVAELAARVEIAGLMTMAPASDTPEDARPAFRDLAQLRHDLANRGESIAAGISLRELSMGMSGDFGVAIEEGATLIRIGSRLFEGLSSDS